MGSYWFGQFFTLVLLLRKDTGPFTLEEIKQATDYVIDHGSGVGTCECFGDYYSLSRIENYPELFKKNITENGTTTISRNGELIPKLEYFFSAYPDSVTHYFERIIDGYLQLKKSSSVYSSIQKTFVKKI